MTATPNEKDGSNNLDYFGEPLITYTLKQGIEDGFLAPYRGSSPSSLDEGRGRGGSRKREMWTKKANLCPCANTPLPILTGR